jgi:hypothetical protein
MRKIGYKTVKLATAVVSAVALATPVPALASPAASTEAGAAATTSAPGVASVAVAPRPRPLTGALLTMNDLPNGYRTMIGGAGGMSMMSNINTDADICDSHIGTTGHKGQSAAAAFVKNGGGPMLFQSLAAVGPRGARDIVRGVAVAPRQCPTVLTNVPTSGQKARLRLAPLRVQRLGDAAAGLQFLVNLPAVGMTVHGKMISVAYRGVALTIMLVGVPQITPQEANYIAATAVRKLQRLS